MAGRVPLAALALAALLAARRPRPPGPDRARALRLRRRRGRDGARHLRRLPRRPRPRRPQLQRSGAAATGRWRSATCPATATSPSCRATSPSSAPATSSRTSRCSRRGRRRSSTSPWPGRALPARQGRHRLLARHARGRFVHVSDSIPKKLAPVRGFVWYTVDVAYDVDAGLYDLTIHEEGRAEPVVALRDQPGAASQPGSAVDVFSFISDPMEDVSDVTYYVDDVVIATSRDVAVPPLVAPGRRKLFVDAFAEYRRTQDEKVRCLPAVSLRGLRHRPGHGPLGARGLTLARGGAPVRGQGDRRSACPRTTAPRRGVGAAAQWRRGMPRPSREATRRRRWSDSIARPAIAPRGPDLRAERRARPWSRPGEHAAAADRLAAIASEWADDATLRDRHRTAGRGPRRRRGRAGDAAPGRGGGRRDAPPSATTRPSSGTAAGAKPASWSRPGGARAGRAAQTAADWLERAGDAAFQLGDDAGGPGALRGSGARRARGGLALPQARGCGLRARGRRVGATVPGAVLRDAATSPEAPSGRGLSGRGPNW